MPASSLDFLFLLPLFLFSLVMASFNHFSLLLSLSSLFLSLFSFLFRPLDGGRNMEISDVVLVDDGGGCDDLQPPEEETSGGGAPEVSDEKGTNEFVFSFRFQTYEEFTKSNKRNLGCERLDSLSNRYEFFPEKSTSHFVEEPGIPSFTVEVLNSCSNFEIPRTGDFSVREFSGKVLDSQTITVSYEVSGEIPESEVIGETAELSSTNSREEQMAEKQSELKQRDERETDFVSDYDINLNVGGYEPDEETNEELEKWGEEEEELNGLETEWEHQELIEQLKMELKKVRASGLPTISEESESPKIMEELKPWKIDERFKRGDLMEELHSFYRSYRERMRKLDILNYQKMYAMGVLQSKDPLKSFSSNTKSSSPSITSVLRLYRQKKCQVDPMKDFIREVHCDLEMVYVAQMCLSWEFIQWQYGKALDLWESEPHGLHHYNEVAGEFQHFQVLLERFLENEAFEGPRVENYVKQRCVVRNLLQVPVIREDKTRDRRKARQWRDHENEAITNDMLVEILQESIRVISQFIRADKVHNPTATLKRPKKFQVELQDPTDMQLLTEIQVDLQKKERKVKEKMRSGHCILKKLKKNEEEEETEGAVSFFSEMDMKLVGRVLKMSRITTDQLIWCRNKLSRIHFKNTRIHLEPSFFLFPC
ncbi:uncharacterized protein LOC111469544 isoform X1 [Cucurbita maxima]|uniref:Uncharacterized protein LOC111469544 isoform X1 n=1 Tax=Cucurbita maxima TaxID=3661 RepID=A0A6J1HZL3_CUCMA|nr:uncharacterized protein LOC111469544 isoform X1 [Cucurbita maxima]